MAQKGMLQGGTTAQLAHWAAARTRLHLRLPWRCWFWSSPSLPVRLRERVGVCPAQKSQALQDTQETKEQLCAGAGLWWGGICVPDAKPGLQEAAGVISWVGGQGQLALLKARPSVPPHPHRPQMPARGGSQTRAAGPRRRPRQ